MNFCPTIKIFRESETSQQDGPYGQLLDVSQHVFTCDSAKVQKSPKTPPPLVPPRTFIRGSFFENRPSKTVSLQNKQTNTNKTKHYIVYIIYIIYYILYIIKSILYIIYYMLYVVCCLLYID